MKTQKVIPTIWEDKRDTSQNNEVWNFFILLLWIIKRENNQTMATVLCLCPTSQNLNFPRCRMREWDLLMMIGSRS